MPTSVVLNGWLCTGLLATFEMDEISALKDVVLEEVKAEFKPQVGNYLLTEKAIQTQCAQVAKEKGEAWMPSRSNTPSHTWTLVRGNLTSGMMTISLSFLKTFVILKIWKISILLMQRIWVFMSAEDNISICEEVRAENAIDVAVNAALRTAEIMEEVSQKEDYSSEEEQQVECILESFHERVTAGCRGVPKVGEIACRAKS